MSKLKQRTSRTQETKAVEKALESRFPNAAISTYRYNSASIRVRIIDESFKDLSRIEREDRVLPVIKQLPEETQKDITMLLLLAPGDEEVSLVNAEFEDPTQSFL